MNEAGSNDRGIPREGNLEAPTRHPLDWTSGEFWNHAGLDAELERVFEICHGCRRCVSLCHAFPTLFDLVDESTTMEVDGVDKADYPRVVEQCYLCDLCYQTKCPYVPPHPWNVDFPHLMLRAKAVHFREHGAPLGAKVLASTTAVGKLASIPVVVEAVNWGNRQPLLRAAMEGTLGVHRDARVPEYHADTAKRRLRGASGDAALQLHVAKRSREDVVRFLEQEALATHERALKSLEFIEHPLWRTYVFCYAGGERLLSQWVESAGDKTAQHARFFRLLTEQITPSGIAADSV